ncbi:MAG: nuclear transport factor 2 family protein [Ignavibacteria bacterium]|nr:nuclear transport factor 2 family protein [Ignavibacteria bacterium]
MKLSKELKSEVMQVYDTWWHSYLNGDVKTYDSFLDENYRFVGSTDAENYLDRLDTTKFFEATAYQLAGKAQLRNRTVNLEIINELIFITDLADAYFLYDAEWSYYSKFRFTSVIKKSEAGLKFIYQHFSAPDSKAGEGETIGFEKVANENIELRDAIKRRTIDLENKNRELEATMNELKATQAQLIQSEKMASLGELTAGIAHEIQNPLNFVNNFSELNTELLSELEDEIEKGNTAEMKALTDDIKANEQKINHHGKRADAIVKGMLQHSRTSSGVKEPTDINALADEYLRLAYHGLRAKDKSFNATMKTDFDENIGNVNVVPQDTGRVILNLITNAFYAVNEKKKQNKQGYEPTVSVSTKNAGEKIEIRVSDNGNGITQKVVDKIFQPFFTTKPTGEGTGLGLSMSYDIIKSHGGEIKVETKEGEGAEFLILLPVSVKN